MVTLAGKKAFTLNSSGFMVAWWFLWRAMNWIYCYQTNRDAEVVLFTITDHDKESFNKVWVGKGGGWVLLSPHCQPADKIFSRWIQSTDSICAARRCNQFEGHVKIFSMSNWKLVSNHYLRSSALHFRAGVSQWQTALCLWFLICEARVRNHQQEFISDPIWSHNVYIIWQLGRNPPLPSNAVAMAFVETIQTLQLICEAWWELRTLKMQNRKDNS